MDPADVRGLLSLLLADGSLVPYRSPSGGYVQLTLTAGVHESAFLEDKVAEFKHFVPTAAQIVPYSTAPRANGKTTMVLRFRVSTNKLRPIYNLLYPHGERTISALALELLGGQAAAWLWAEGARPQANGSALLQRVGQSLAEAERISHWLAMLTGAEGIPDLTRTRPRLVFDAADSRKLREALHPYAPRSRRHLFQEATWDESALRSARTELLLGDGAAGVEGPEDAALAHTAAP